MSKQISMIVMLTAPMSKILIWLSKLPEAECKHKDKSEKWIVEDNEQYFNHTMDV
jgi:hypothetical protein